MSTHKKQSENAYDKGFSDALKEVEKLIEKWRVQLEDIGFITMDKRFVNELKQKISELNHGRRDGKDVAYSDLSETRLSADTNDKKLRGGKK